MSFPKMTIRGAVFEIGERQTSPNGYVWRELVLTDGDLRYPQYLPISFGRERADLLDGLHVDELVDVDFALRGRMAKDGRAFAQLAGLAVARANLAPPGAAEAAPAPSAAPPPTPPGAPPAGVTEDLPF